MSATHTTNIPKITSMCVAAFRENYERTLFYFLFDFQTVFEFICTLQISVMYAHRATGTIHFKYMAHGNQDFFFASNFFSNVYFRWMCGCEYLMAVNNHPRNFVSILTILAEKRQVSGCLDHFLEYFALAFVKIIWNSIKHYYCKLY